MGAAVDWGNGATKIAFTSGSSLAVNIENGLMQLYKSGQSSNIQLYNTTITDGLSLTTTPVNLIRSIAGTSNVWVGVSGESVVIGNTGINPTARLTANSIGLGYVSKSANYTATIDDNTIEVTATGKTITLPTAASIGGRIYTVKLTASGSGTVATTCSQTIDGSTTYSLASQYKYVTVMSTGSNWIVIANN